MSAATSEGEGRAAAAMTRERAASRHVRWPTTSTSAWGLGGGGGTCPLRWVVGVGHVGAVHNYHTKTMCCLCLLCDEEFPCVSRLALIARSSEIL